MNSLVIAAALLAGSTLTATAQETSSSPVGTGAPAPSTASQQASQKPGTPASQVPLKVTVVLSRYQDEKRISSMPYVLAVTSGSKTSLRMGVDVPVSTTMSKPDGPAPVTTSYNYRSVGTHIDCYASGVATGLFQLNMTISDTSIHLERARKQAGAAAIPGDLPAFRSFNSSFSALMRDGQTTQHASATDPVTGEVIRIDLTLNVLK